MKWICTRDSWRGCDIVVDHLSDEREQVGHFPMKNVDVCNDHIAHFPSRRQWTSIHRVLPRLLNHWFIVDTYQNMTNFRRASSITTENTYSHCRHWAGILVGVWRHFRKEDFQGCCNFQWMFYICDLYKCIRECLNKLTLLSHPVHQWDADFACLHQCIQFCWK